MKPQLPFWLVVKDGDKRCFNVVGPMYDDRPWNDAVVAAQEQGREVTCVASEKEESKEQMIQEYSRLLGYSYAEELIVHPLPD